MIPEVLNRRQWITRAGAAAREHGEESGVSGGSLDGELIDVDVAIFGAQVADDDGVGSGPELVERNVRLPPRFSAVEVQRSFPHTIDFDGRMAAIEGLGEVIGELGSLKYETQ